MPRRVGGREVVSVERPLSSLTAETFWSGTSGCRTRVVGPARRNVRSRDRPELLDLLGQLLLDDGFATDDCDGVFLSVDIDVCDPGHAPGTGTPEPGGLSARELLDAVRRICLEVPVVGVDVVEVSPPYDHADITAALANRVVLEALSAIARKRLDERDGTTWDPSRPLMTDREPFPGGTDD
jgi:agmatinase